MRRTDIPDPTPLDEAIWDLYLSAEAPAEYRRQIAIAAGRLFPQRRVQKLNRQYRTRNLDSERARDRARSTPERRARAAAWKAAHPTYKAPGAWESKRAYYAANKDRINATSRARYAAKKAERGI